MDARLTDRMRRAADETAAQGFDALVVAPSPDLAYLTGYDPMPLERPTLLLLRNGKAPTMLVPELERPLAAGSPGGAAIELIGWTDGVDPYAEAARLLPTEGRVAVGDRLWASHVLGLQRAMPGLAFEPASPVIGRLRAVKDDDELAALRRAARGADETFRTICTMTFLGRREEEIAADLADLLLRNGHVRADFTIVASGPNAASPHHEPGGRTILPKDAVVMDFGGELGGYFSDTTRTVVVGEPPAGFERVYDTVREAQSAACDAVAPGIAAQQVDRVARRIIEDAGFGERFVHRTGHGIGLEVHEPPYIVEGNDWILTAGTTFSVEPGVYLEGEYGVRIEDIVAVTADGVERLNRSSRELQVVE
ncbi:MAG: M24 family metallopeptidase [Actinomycetota bacterium]